ncbi:MAG: hypothetical protein HY906_24650, partial [Deltaproteobacteria bacterium]|nr:hypothetical protein [Deltaproteobacteria bacterium]
LCGGSFETAPADHSETPDPFSFAFMSCHQPFNSPDGTLSERAMRMLRLAPAVLRRHDAGLGAQEARHVLARLGLARCVHRPAAGPLKPRGEQSSSVAWLRASAAAPRPGRVWLAAPVVL